MGPAAGDRVSDDVLAGSVWECRSERTPAPTSTWHRCPWTTASWLPAMVPGTVAGALGRWPAGGGATTTRTFSTGATGGTGAASTHRRVPGAGPWQLEFDGLATVADAWLNGEPVLHSENMWVAHRIRVDHLEAHNVLLLRFSALAPLLAQRRPRPRWRSLQLRSQNQRWYRTTLLGRVPGWAASGAPVGPWRPVRLLDTGAGPLVAERRVVATCDGTDGVVSIRVQLRGSRRRDRGRAPRRGAIARRPPCGRGRSGVVDATVRVPKAERWWPHTHGAQPLYRVHLTVDGLDVDLGTVGFRTVEVDREDGAFTLSVNGVRRLLPGRALDATRRRDPAALPTRRCGSPCSWSSKPA